MSQRIEYKKYTRADIETIVRQTAMMNLIGTIYLGEIQCQELRWTDDGGIEVLTTHTPSSWPVGEIK